MASRKFRFVSPGVFLREIDNSQLPRESEAIGPIVIGRTRKGPGMKPYKVKSLEEFERVFGRPMPGNEGVGDPWRDGTDILAESYAPYAAKAYLTSARDTDSPLTVVRLLGVTGDDATTFGEPGWQAKSAHGVFLMPSSSAQSATGSLDLELAAIFYSTETVDKFSIKAKGKLLSGSASDAHVGKPVKLDDQDRITLQLSSSTTKDVRFSFDNIRKEFNTNPVSTNKRISSPVASSLADKYWLGETFDDTYKRMSKDHDNLAVVVLPLDSQMGDFKSSTHHEMQAARTGWVFGQDTSLSGEDFDATQHQRLFRLIALHEGIQTSKEIIVGIEDIKVPRPGATNRFGSFSVVVRRIGSTRLETIERFDNCNLDPSSPDFIAKKIGDQYYQWSPSEKRNKIYGENPNISEYIRVEMNLDVVTQGGPVNPEHVPFGFYGPVVPSDTKVVTTAGSGSLGNNSWVSGTFDAGSGNYLTNATASFKWSESLTTNSASLDQGFYQGFTPYTRTFNEHGASKANNKISDSYIDYVRRMPDAFKLADDQTSGLLDVSGSTKYSFVFSLDEVVLVPSTRTDVTHVANITGKGDVRAAYWASGTHSSGSSPNTSTNPRAFTWHIANGDVTGSADGIRTLLEVVDGFHMPLVGGFDGTNITEADPFNADGDVMGTNSAESYAYASVDRAIELIKDPEAVEHNLALMPGITEPSLTTKLVDVCEARADSMAIIDLPNVYIPPFQEKCDNFQKRMPDIGNPENSAKNLVQRQLNSSYGAAYYPWVKIKDEQASRDVWVPPSVVALGVMGYTESSSEIWFAPAGFNRGGLNQGNAGVPVLQVTEQMLSKDRDTLYAANINPIASFVSEGIVIFGQKTLQSEQSALDRINVRRLLIFVKKEISRISSTLLFEQNVQATWAKFHKRAKTLLDSVKVRFGLTDYKVVLDDTTTTPDLVDRNIMYAKIFLKPARAIEFIAVDFVITNTGAEFGD